MVKVAWFLSAFAALASLLYAYASWPEMLTVFESEGTHTASREYVFYSFLGALTVLNCLVYVISALHPGEGSYPLRAWYHSFTVSLNLFLIIALQYLNLFNSGEKFAFEKIGPIIYGGIVLVVITAAVWPVYLAWQGLSGKLNTRQ